ncbi:type VI secretion system baseplate subunit TssG, partial [Bordetella bronchiseptica]
DPPGAPGGRPPACGRAGGGAPPGHALSPGRRGIAARAGAPAPLGRGASPRHEPVRMRQEPSLAFAPATLAAARAPGEGAAPELSIYSFGLFGPNGPLPLHLTEHARERRQHHGDHSLAAFADLFHHRLILLFYRAWADAQSTASLDRGQERFSGYVASLLHLGAPSLRRRDSVMDHAKYHMAGHLLRQTRNPEGLCQVLRAFFGLPVGVDEFVAQWIRLEAGQRLRLGAGGGLGGGAPLGVAVRDAQHKFRIRLGPLDWQDYLAFLPGSARARQLLHWVRLYVGVEFAWEVRPVLRRDAVRGVRLGAAAPLGLASWLGRRPPRLGDAAELLLDYEGRERQAARRAQAFHEKEQAA